MTDEAAAALAVNIDVDQERKKPRLIALLFCDFVNQTAEGKINAIGGFDRIFGDKDTSTPQFILFVRTAETLEGELKVTIIDPNKKPIAGIFFGQGGERINPNYQQMQLIAPIRFQITAHGLFWFDVSYKNESLGGGAISVDPRPQEPEKQGT